MYDPRKHNYFEKLKKFIEETKLPRSQISNVDICHDDWCAIYRGGYCNCDPEIRLWPAVERN